MGRTAGFLGAGLTGRETLLLAFPGLLVVAVLLAFTAAEGGFFPATFYPGVISTSLLLAAIVIGRGRALTTLPRATVIALGFGAAFVLWSFASIAWADSSGAALDAANRSLLYVSIFAIFAVWPWNRRAAAICIGAFGIGVAAIAFIVLLEAGNAADPASYLVKGRLAEPVGYQNGNPAVLLAAAFPLLYLAARWDTPWPIRGLALGSVGVLVQVAILSQSRGSLAAGGVAAVLLVALVPGRARLGLAISVVTLATVWALDPLLDVWTEANRADDFAGPALRDAADAVTRSLVPLVAFGLAWGLFDSRLEVEIELGRGGRRAAQALAAIAVAGLLVAVIAVAGNPINRVGDAWNEFAEGPPEEFGSSRFESGLGSTRSEFWDVALDELADRPLTGMGAGNFVIAYARERRRASEEPLYPHSMPIEIASQTGLVGALFFMGFLGAALAVAARSRRLDPASRGLAAAAIVTFVYFVVHAAGDWLFEIPAVAGAAFAALGLAAGLGGQVPDSRATAAGRAAGGMLGKPASLVVAIVTAAALVASVPPWLSAATVERAKDVWRNDPKLAFDRFDRARELNPLSDRPDLVAGAIAAERGERHRARRYFAGAVERTPKSWFAQQQLGLELALAGRRSDAEEHLERAHELNPLEVTTRMALRAVRRGDPVPAAEVRELLVERACIPVPNASGC